MRESTRRRICRIAFLVLCAAPTLGLLGIAAYRHSPLFAHRQRAHWERVIQQHTGLNAHVKRVAYPRGDVALLEGLTLTDPDSRRVVVQMRQAELVRTQGELMVVLSQPEIEPGQFLRLWDVLHDRLLRSAVSQGIQARARELTLKDAPRPVTFTDVHCVLAPSADSIRAVADFRVAGITMDAPARIEIVRNRVMSPPATGWEIRTGSVPLPCSLLAAYVPPLAGLGPDCRFAGRVWAEPSRQLWNGGLSGRFEGVALERLIAPFPHKLSGTADVVLDHVDYRDGRLCEAAGAVDCRGGVVSRSLLARFADTYGFDKAARLDEEDDPCLEYTHLAVGFDLDEQVLRLTGRCGATPGVLLADRQGPLVFEGSADPLPAMALAQALSPEGGLQVPATAESHLLLRALPLPGQAAQRQRTADRSTYTPLRFYDR